jgi:predicted phage terminase large subunit-like protein
VTSGNADTDNWSLVTGHSLYWDPSGGRAKSDASVCVLVYRDDKNRRAFIHDVRYLTADDNDVHPLATQCAAVLDFMAAHNAKHIAIEVNGLGGALPEVLRDVAIKRGQSVIVQKVVNHQQKALRILDAIEPLLTTGRLFAHERIRMTPLCAEMLGWSPLATGGHDDGLDAIAGALRGQAIPVRPLGAAARPIMANTNFKI